jgi:prepilin-type N-terminal cleavage/methylation domain-containing protein
MNDERQRRWDKPSNAMLFRSSFIVHTSSFIPSPLDILNTSPNGAPLKRRGFTLLELVVVIALLALLAGMLVMGIGKMQTNGKRQQTRLILQNLSAMFADYDVNRRVPMGMGNFAAFNSLPQTGTPSQQYLTNYLYTPCPQNVNLDYNMSAESGTMPTNVAPFPAGADRKGLDGNLAVPNTRCFMAQIAATPNNAASIGKLPSASIMTYAGFDPSGQTPANWNKMTYYRVGDYANDGNGNLFIRTQLNLDSSGSVQYDTAIDAPPNYYYWMPALRVLTPTVLPSPPGTQGVALSTPVILDAWGNPIIFVLGGVLGNNPSNVTLTASYTPPVGSGGIITGSGSSATATQVHSPDYHPFFASAGPDGDFSKGDDNLYSFEK